MFRENTIFLKDSVSLILNLEGRLTTPNTFKYKFNFFVSFFINLKKKKKKKKNPSSIKISFFSKKEKKK